MIHCDIKHHPMPIRIPDVGQTEPFANKRRLQILPSDWFKYGIPLIPSTMAWIWYAAATRATDRNSEVGSVCFSVHKMFHKDSRIIARGRKLPADAFDRPESALLEG